MTAEHIEFVLFRTVSASTDVSCEAEKMGDNGLFQWTEKSFQLLLLFRLFNVPRKIFNLANKKGFRM